MSVLGKAVLGLGLGLGFFLCPWPWPRALCPRLHLCDLLDIAWFTDDESENSDQDEGNNEHAACDSDENRNIQSDTSEKCLQNLFLLSGKSSKMTPEENKFLIEWLEQIPTMDSHYCRNIPSYRDKNFFYPGTTQAQLHHEYQKAAETAYVRSANIFYFSQIILKNNYSIFSPRKDLCDVCISFQNDNLSKEAYDYHILLKNETRNEKNEDKVFATEKKSI